jgi:hypothetical protein
MSAAGPTWSEVKALPFNPSPAAKFTAQFSAKGMARAIFSPGAIIPLVAAPLLRAALEAACVHIAGGKMVLQDGDAYETCDMVGESILQGAYRIDSPATPDWHPSMRDACLTDAQKAISYAWRGATVTSAWWDGNGSCEIDSTGGHMSIGFRGPAQVSVTSGPKPLTVDQAQQKVADTLQQWTQEDFLYGYQKHRTPELLTELVNTVGVEPSGVSVDLSGQDPSQVTTTQNDDGSSTQTMTIPEPDRKQETVNADGSKTITTTKTSHEITAANPSPSKDGGPITNTTITITNITNSHTEVTTVSKDGTVVSSSTTTESKPEKPKTDDPCIANPDKIGCATFGTPDKGPDIPRDAKQVDFSPVPFASSGCPAPIDFQVFGQPYQFRYDTLCDKLQLVSGLLLALSALASAYIFAEGLKV